jgi:biotin transport system substrate-specific component
LIEIFCGDKNFSVYRLEGKRSFKYNVEQIFGFGKWMDMLTNITVADVFRPALKRLAVIYDIALVIGGSLFIALSAQIAVHLPFSPVPVTGQTFAVLLTGALFGSRRGCLSVLLYVIEGMAGLPVFAMGRGGLPVLFSPTGGYIVGFIAAAYLTGLLAEKGWDRRTATAALAMALGNIVIYTSGLLWLACLRFIFRVPIESGGLFLVGVYPFIIGDILKIILAAILLPSGWRLLRYFRK